MLEQCSEVPNGQRGLYFRIVPYRAQVMLLLNTTSMVPTGHSSGALTGSGG